MKTILYKTFAASMLTIAILGFALKFLFPQYYSGNYALMALSFISLDAIVLSFVFGKAQIKQKELNKKLMLGFTVKFFTSLLVFMVFLFVHKNQLINYTINISLLFIICMFFYFRALMQINKSFSKTA